MPMHEEEEWQNRMEDMIQEYESLKLNTKRDYPREGYIPKPEDKEKFTPFVVHQDGEGKIYRCSPTEDNKCLDCPYYIHGWLYCLKDNNGYWGSSNYMKCHPIHENLKDIVPKRKCFGQWFENSNCCKYTCEQRFECYKEHERLMEAVIRDAEKDRKEHFEHLDKVSKNRDELASMIKTISDLRLKFLKLEVIGEDSMEPFIIKLWEELEEFDIVIGGIMNLYFPSESPNMD